MSLLEKVLLKENKFITKQDIGWIDKNGNVVPKEEKRILDDAKSTLIKDLPFKNAERYITSLKDVSPSDGRIKLEAKLKNGDIINMYKTSRYIGYWDFYINGKKIGSKNMNKSSVIYDYYYEKLSDLEKYLLALGSFDKNSMYSDDFRYFNTGSNEKKELSILFNKLNKTQRLKAYVEYLKKYNKTDIELPFTEFKGY